MRRPHSLSKVAWEQHETHGNPSLVEAGGALVRGIPEWEVPAQCVFRPREKGTPSVRVQEKNRKLYNSHV